MPRGGARKGNSATNYPNRTDLSTAKALPITAVPGQPYGVAKAQMDAQRVAPMASAPLPVAPQASPAAPSTPPPLSGPPPGSLGDLFGATNRPDEHFMTGVNAGPGPGSEALASLTPDPTVGAIGLLKTLPQLSPQVSMILKYLEASAANGATY